MTSRSKGAPAAPAVGSADLVVVGARVMGGWVGLQVRRAGAGVRRSRGRSR
jgi:hypothetical protein